VFAGVAELVDAPDSKLGTARCGGSIPSTRILGGVVQLVRTLACHARGRRFESGHSRSASIV